MHFSAMLVAWLLHWCEGPNLQGDDLSPEVRGMFRERAYMRTTFFHAFRKNLPNFFSISPGGWEAPYLGRRCSSLNLYDI